MTPFVAKQISRLKLDVSLPADKSIAHRAIIISAISRSKTKLENFPLNKDCLLTLNALRKLGVKIISELRDSKKERFSAAITVNGKGFFGLTKPKNPIFVGDSGTTLRILLGVLAGQDFETKLIAGKSLSSRPMRRVTEPLRLMGAQISSKFVPRLGSTSLTTSRSGQEGHPSTWFDFAHHKSLGTRGSRAEEYPPITIKGGRLKPITYRMPVASAQVKSAILLAGLFAKGETKVVEPLPTRDHTERMLKLFKADIKLKGRTIIVKGKGQLVSPGRIYIPADISSAAFFIALAAIIPNSKIRIRKVGLNPLRIGVIKVLKRMGADIRVKGHPSTWFDFAHHKSLGTRGSSLDLVRLRSPQVARDKRVKGCEPMGDLLVGHSLLRGTVVKKEEVPSLIDELPVLMVAACFAKGRTIFEGAEELRVKETDRISSMSENLKKMGAEISISKTGNSEKIIVEGKGFLKGANVKSFGDHRTAMSMVVAGLAARGITYIDDVSCIEKSFPSFLDILNSDAGLELCSNPASEVVR